MTRGTGGELTLVIRSFGFTVSRILLTLFNINFSYKVFNVDRPQTPPSFFCFNETVNQQKRIKTTKLK